VTFKQNEEEEVARQHYREKRIGKKFSIDPYITK